MERVKFERPAVSRRRFITGLGAAAFCAAAGAPTKPVRALPPPRKLVIILASGGWDTTYVFDPKPGAAKVDTPPGNVQMFGGLPVYTDGSRPQVTEFFSRYADRLSLVNGIQVRSFIHPDCIKRVLSGTPSNGAPDIAAVTAAAHGASLPVPYLALGGQARSGPLSAVTGRTGTSNQLSALLDPTAAYRAVDGLSPEPLFRPREAEAASVRSYLENRASDMMAARALHGSNRAKVDDYVASLKRADRLRDFARGTGLGDRSYTLDMAVQIPLAVRALSEGLSHTVLMQSGDWDTHRDNNQQGALYDGLFASLTDLVSAFEQAGLFDQTVFVVLSEMGRTPKLNVDQGKDHWPVTSAMVFGGGVRGGALFGATDGRLDAVPVSFASGQASADGLALQSSNFAAGLLRAVGVDPTLHLPGVEPFDAFVL